LNELTPELDTLQARLGYVFRDRNLLQVALTHPSLAHELGPRACDNQRLEFLGDAVLQLVVTRELYDRFPDSGEGPLTKARAHMVNRRTLAGHGRQLALGSLLRMSRGEESSGGRQRQSAQADAFEALLGAICLDGGYDAARIVVLRLFGEALGHLIRIPNVENPKGELQELLQAQSNEAPRYTLESVAGPDHDRVFVCAVTHAGVELGRGSGKSKKEAEAHAAVAALRAIPPRPLDSTLHDADQPAPKRASPAAAEGPIHIKNRIPSPRTQAPTS
jgi:ribonuclease III